MKKLLPSYTVIIITLLFVFWKFFITYLALVITGSAVLTAAIFYFGSKSLNLNLKKKEESKTKGLIIIEKGTYFIIKDDR